MSTPAPAVPDVESLEGQYAGFVTRMIAFVIDILIINVSVLVVTGVVLLILNFFYQLYMLLPWAPTGRAGNFSSWASGLVALLTLIFMLWLYPTIFWMISGQTFGKRIMGLRVVRMNGEEMTLARGLLRVLGYLLSALPIFLGFIWVIFSDKRRGWHDMLSGTCVIYSWDARDSTALRSRMIAIRDARRAAKGS